MNDVRGGIEAGAGQPRGWALVEALRSRPVVDQLHAALRLNGLDGMVTVSSEDGRIHLGVPDEEFESLGYETLRARTEQVEDVVMALLGARLQVVQPQWARGQRWAVYAAFTRGTLGELLEADAADGAGRRLLDIQRRRWQRDLPLLGAGTARRFAVPAALSWQGQGAEIG